MHFFRGNKLTQIFANKCYVLQYNFEIGVAHYISLEWIKVELELIEVEEWSKFFHASVDSVKLLLYDAIFLLRSQCIYLHLHLFELMDLILQSINAALWKYLLHHSCVLAEYFYFEFEFFYLISITFT